MPKIHRQDDFFWSGLGLFYALVLWFCAPQIKGAVLLGQLAAVALLISYSWQVIKLRKAIVNPSQQQNLDGFSVTSFIGGFFNRSPKVKESKPEKTEKEEKVEVAAQESRPSEKAEEASGAGEASGAEEASGVGEENIPIVAATEENVVEETGDLVSETTAETTPETTESKDDTVIQKADTVIQIEESNIAAASQDVPVETATEAESEAESTTPSNISDKTEKTEKKPGFFDKLLHFGDKEPQSAPENTTSLTNTKLDELLDEEDEDETNSDVKAETIPDDVTVASAETTIIKEEETEEETNWDFLDEEPETTPEKATKKEEE